MPKHRLTAPQRAALELAERGQLSEENTHIRVLDLVWERGWITWRDRNTFPGTARLTDEGRDVLYPPPRQRSTSPRFLQRDIWRGGDYTTDPSRSIDYDAGGAVEALVTNRDLEQFAHNAKLRQEAASQKAGAALDQLTFTARIENVKTAARSSKANINRELRLVEHMHGTGRTDRASARLRALEIQFGKRAA